MDSRFKSQIIKNANMKQILLLLVVVFSFSACEKDDICDADTPTTPRLIIQFYDIAIPTALKNVNNLKVTAEGEIPLDVFSGESTITLPLKTTDDITKYSLILNSTSTTGTDNEDFLQFDYARQTVYVSRACGYKTIFDLNSPNGVTKTDAATPDGFWIQNIIVQTTAIANENETHIKIYF
jgi:hypothetical protein